jgi:hypothetical protein
LGTGRVENIYNQIDEIKEDDMVKACSMNGDKEE